MLDLEWTLGEPHDLLHGFWKSSYPNVESICEERTEPLEDSPESVGGNPRHLKSYLPVGGGGGSVLKTHLKETKTKKERNPIGEAGWTLHHLYHEKTEDRFPSFRSSGKQEVTHRDVVQTAL